MKKYKLSLLLFHRLRYEFLPVLRSVNRQHELHRLVVWAERKRLAKPRHLYENRLRDEEDRLLRYRMTDPRLVSLA